MTILSPHTNHAEKSKTSIVFVKPLITGLGEYPFTLSTVTNLSVLFSRVTCQVPSTFDGITSS